MHTYNLVEMHTHSIKTMNNTNNSFTVRYQIPYNNCEWRTQIFMTKEDAESMIIFYRSCGVPAHLE